MQIALEHTLDYSLQHRWPRHSVTKFALSIPSMAVPRMWIEARLLNHDLPSIARMVERSEGERLAKGFA